jgi:hypothetical protein
MQNMVFADTRRFAHETIDGETVIIDTACGHLFLLTGAGPWLWHRMIAGCSIQSVIDELTGRFGGDAGVAARVFLNKLVDYGLIVTEVTGETAVTEARLPPDVFVTPMVEKFEDIADIIAMDPIHDIDPGKGWPYRPPDAEVNDV